MAGTIRVVMLADYDDMDKGWVYDVDLRMGLRLIWIGKARSVELECTAVTPARERSVRPRAMRRSL
tara:strand:- start:435 stop:632 length:198 start_codon:yes stop_codon:yes gene_type:complete